MPSDTLFGLKRRVLVIDDDEGVRLFVRSVMEQEGWAVSEAENGQVGLDLAESEQPMLIVLDLIMPVMDGFKTFRALRASPLTERIPIIVLTAVNEVITSGGYTADTLAAAFSAEKPEGFVEKPVDAVFLRQCVFGVIG